MKVRQNWGHGPYENWTTEQMIRQCVGLCEPDGEIERLRHSRDVLIEILANVLDRITASDSEKLDLMGAYGWEAES